MPATSGVALGGQRTGVIGDEEIGLERQPFGQPGSDQLDTERRAGVAGCPGDPDDPTSQVCQLGSGPDDRRLRGVDGSP